jgi:hypothetical protein
MKPIFSSLVLLVAVSVLAACNPATDVATDELGAYVAAPPLSIQDGKTADPGSVSCPCFSRRSLAGVDGMISSEGIDVADYYLFFDVFNYYGLDARRTEARALVSTPAGPFEEVAAVYITSGNDEDLFLICHRQEVVVDPMTGAPEYHYETLAPTVEEAEACRRDLYAEVATEESCQGPACGIEYSKEQLDPDYPPYHDGNLRTPESLLDTIRERVETVGQLLRVPA